MPRLRSIRSMLPRTGLAAMLIAAAACAERDARVAEPLAPHRRALDAAALGGGVLGCPPAPDVRTRTGMIGHPADLNGNGVVCERQPRLPGLPSGMPTSGSFTDDLLLPAGTRPAAP